MTSASSDYVIVHRTGLRVKQTEPLRLLGLSICIEGGYLSGKRTQSNVDSKIPNPGMAYLQLSVKQ